MGSDKPEDDVDNVEAEGERETCTGGIGSRRWELGGRVGDNSEGKGRTGQGAP